MKASKSTAQSNTSGTRLKSKKSTSNLFKKRSTPTLSERGGSLQWGNRTSKTIPSREEQRAAEERGDGFDGGGGNGRNPVQKKRSLGGGSKVATIKIPAYNHTAFVVICAAIAKQVLSKDVPNKWQRTLEACLDKVHEIDLLVCLLQPHGMEGGK